MRRLNLNLNQFNCLEEYPAGMAISDDACGGDEAARNSPSPHEFIKPGTPSRDYHFGGGPKKFRAKLFEEAYFAGFETLQR